MTDLLLEFEQTLELMLSERRIRIYEIIAKLYRMVRSSQYDFERLDKLMSVIVTGKEQNVSIFWGQEEVGLLTDEELKDVEQFILDGQAIHQIEPGPYELNLLQQIAAVKATEEEL